MRRFRFARKIALPLCLGRPDRLSGVLLRFVAGCGERFETRSQHFLSLPRDFFDGSLGRFHPGGDLRFDLLRGSPQSHGGFFSLLHDLTEVFRSASQLLLVFAALREPLLRKLRGKMPRQLFKLRSETLRQFFLQCCRGSFMRRATSRLRFFLNSVDRFGNFLRQ